MYFLIFVVEVAVLGHAVGLAVEHELVVELVVELGSELQLVLLLELVRELGLELPELELFELRFELVDLLLVPRSVQLVVLVVGLVLHVALPVPLVAELLVLLDVE